MDDRSILILYVTETGTAQDVAERLARLCRRIHFTCRVLSTDKYSLSDLISEQLVLFVVSTTGSGSEPRSMTVMWKTLLRSDLPPDLFDDLSFAIFGLGDTAYEKFCWPAKKLSRRLVGLGATEFCNRGEGDDQHPMGVDGALESWMGAILESLLQTYPLPDGLEMMPATVIPPARASIVQDSSSSTSITKMPGFPSAVVKCNQRITAEDWYQDVRHLEFHFDNEIQFSPGDVAVIRPLALPREVESLLESMGWLDMADSSFRIHHKMPDLVLPDHLPDVVTLRTIFTQYLDFGAVPRRPFFEYLRYLTTDDLEREKLDEFLSREGADDLYEYCYRVKRTIREVLAEFRHQYPSQIHLCVAIVKYQTKLKIPRRGVCTTFLASLRPGDKVQIGLQKGLIRLPPENNTPVICIGPGTGVAPMRAVIQERLHQGASDNILYFGCRSTLKDAHYAPEWQAHASAGQLTYRPAFSRDVTEGTKRIYVQDLIREDSQHIWTLLSRGAYVFISGSSNKMPAAVKDALRFAAETHGNLSPSLAEDFITGMEARGQLIEECWS
ncbi:riboflavin synthase domain-like protein [Roridomyces roridus]|uniref:Riboflavin synthase domain-like protein n=1 Tax=Roridomyces roridus TaxID=1738132 RepID=A0AAD7G2Q2_9AGAR|nr:riboflavin synthase domain-like protein [Roridomyces roridus]